MGNIKLFAVNERDQTEVIIVSDKSKEIEKKLHNFGKELKSKKIVIKLFGESEVKKFIDTVGENKILGIVFNDHTENYFDQSLGYGYGYGGY